jgi:hypothetical protein
MKRRRRVLSLEGTALKLRMQTMLLKAIAHGLVTDPVGEARQLVESGRGRKMKEEVRLVALPILVANNGLGRTPDPMQMIAAHLEAQHALLKAIASGRVENPIAEVREFLAVVGSFTLKRVNPDIGSWPFDADPLDLSELLVPGGRPSLVC